MVQKDERRKINNDKYSAIGIFVVMSAAILAVCLVCVGVSLVANEWFIEDVVQKTQPVMPDIEEISNEVPSENQAVDVEIETSASEETGTNYFTERITWDDDSVVVLGELDVNEDNLAELNELLEDYSKEIALKAVTIDGTKGLSYNSEEEFFMASAVKAPYLLYAYRQIEAGDGALDEEMKYTGNFYHQGTGKMRYMPVGTVFTLEKIMRYTMRNSDNVGYNMCVARWGKEGYNELMTELGCLSFVLEDWTPWVYEGKLSDLLLIWNEIYKFMNNGSESARAMYDSCTYIGQTSDYNFMKNVLPDTLVSQKYGWSEDGYGNCAIVYGEKQTYIVAVFMDSSGTGEDQLVYRDVVKIVNELLDK